MVYARCETGFFIVCSLSGSFFAKAKYTMKKKNTVKRSKHPKIIVTNNISQNIIKTTNVAVNMPISHKIGFKADFLSTKIAFSIVFFIFCCKNTKKNAKIHLKTAENQEKCRKTTFERTLTDINGH